MTSEKDSTLAMSERSPHVPQLRRFAVPAMAAVGTLSLASCAKDAPQDTWQPAGENAQTIQDLQWWVFLIAGIVGVLVFSAVLYIVIRFKDRGQPIPEQTHGNPLIEYTFIAIPAVLLAIIGGFTGASIGANVGISSSSIDYVRLHPTDPVVIEGSIDGGYHVPKSVKVHAIDGDPDHGYFYTNDRVYIVNLADGTVVYSPGTVVAQK